MDRGAWQATVHGITESDTAEHTSTHYLIYGNDNGAVSAIIRYVTQSSLVDS